MSKKISISINNKKYPAKPNQAILDVALENGFDIPTLCKHPDLKIQGKCRICLVELENGQIVTSCSTPVENGMKVKLDTPSVKRARATNLEMIYAEHIEKCDSCIHEESCVLKKYSEKYGARIARFQDRKRKAPVWIFGKGSGFIQFDASKCIDCGICTEICREHQTVDFYETRGKGYLTQTKPTEFGSDQEEDTNKSKDCTYCGQCVVHCPVGAIQGVPHWPQVEKLLKQKNNHKKILVAQIAPSIRVSIGEEFDMPHGRVVTGQLASSMRALGFDAAFDVTVGADFTTYEEARELVHWLESGKDRPMITSCCPGWMKFVEFYYPDFVPHITTTRSPHIISGILTKTYWAELTGKNPKDIIVVSIMPCTAKKQEITLKRHYLKNMPAVDYVLTTREYAYLLKRNKIDFKKIKPTQMDNPLGQASGAAVIYGASGGVMESALRTADYFLRVKKETGSLDSVLQGQKLKLNKYKFSRISQNRIDFKQARGLDGVKEAVVEVGGVKLKVAVINELKNARHILDQLSDRKIKYDYIEVMACPGGCIGGGGQPVPVTADIRAKRAASLYNIDQKSSIRAAHDNSSLLSVYNTYFKGNEKLIEKLLHCKYKPVGRAGYRKV